MTSFGPDESICEQLARKYGISNSAATPNRNFTPRKLLDETFQNSADVSLATANYFERHSIGRKRKPIREQPDIKENEFKNRLEPIVDYLKLEKLQNFK